MKSLLTIAMLLYASSASALDCGPRPSAWCGWWLRCHPPLFSFWGDPGPKYNRALQWAKFGRPAPGPGVGVIVVWNKGKGRGHVGVITGQATGGGWLVTSGNDGRAVRERPRDISRAYALRVP